MHKFSSILLLFAIILIAGCRNSGEKNSGSTGGGNPELSGKSLLSQTGFYFVGMLGGNAGIYKFDGSKNRIEKFWASDSEKVVDLSYSPGRKSIYFLTASNYGKNGVFPFINGIKLYLLNPDSSKASFIFSIGDGLQVFTSWETDNSFKVTLNSFDNTVANYVNQHTLIFSEFGRVLVNETKTFDITKEGYPGLPEIPLIKKSPYGNFSILTPDSTAETIYLKNTRSGKSILITKGSQKLNNAAWTPDNKYLIFSTINISPRNETLYKKNPATSQIIIYSLADKVITYVWKGSGIKNFFIEHGLLIFDDGFGGNSLIKIYDYNNLKLLKTITVKGGCGLRNIPVIPDYSA